MHPYQSQPPYSHLPAAQPYCESLPLLPLPLYPSWNLILHPGPTLNLPQVPVLPQCRSQASQVRPLDLPCFPPGLYLHLHQLHLHQLPFPVAP